MYTNKFLFTLILIITFISSKAATIKGTVVDEKTAEPIIGAAILIKEATLSTVTLLDGSYKFHNLKPGTYTLEISYFGYQKKTISTTLTNEEETVKLDVGLAETVNELNEVVVSGNNKESDESARKNEKNADNVMNVMSAKTIELLPDVTVGNVLQRVSGVSIVRNASGDGQYAIIRGMDKRYNYTLVNGIKIPSPDNKNRYVPMDIFPAELLEKLEVVKALTPNMEGDAIGGAMNMVMKSAPSKLTITATVAGGFSNIFNSNRPFSGFSTNHIAEKSPETLYGPHYPANATSDFGVSQLNYHNRNKPMNSLMSLSIGNRFFKQKLGILAAVSYQNIFRGTNSVFYVPDEPSAFPNPNTYVFQEVQLRKYSILQNRLGTHLKTDYAFSKNHKFSLYNLFMQLDEEQHRNYQDPQASGVTTQYVHDRSKYTRQRIYNNTLRGDHAFIHQIIKLDWTGAYSVATSNTPAWSDMEVISNYDSSSRLVSQQLKPLTEIWTNNKDEDKSGYANLTLSPLKDLGITKFFDIELMGGGMARYKTRNNVYVSYEIGTLAPGGNYIPYTNINDAVSQFSFNPPSNAYANPSDPNNYKAKENITAYYGQSKFTILKKLQILGGARTEHTYQEYHSQLSIYKTGRDGTIQYTDLLPSAHIRYALTKKQNLRLSYYKAIARPNYFEFIPVEVPGDLFTEAGNYKIKHSRADNYDLRYEFFNKGNEQLLAGVFYKKIVNPIEYGFVPITVSTSYVVPQNYGTATNYGFEFVATKYIKSWGINANYTYTNSSIVQPKKYIAKVDSTIVSSLKDQTRPLQGQSKHIANISLMYKNPKLGFDAQLSWVYTGRRINIISAYYNLDYWQRGFSQFDFSAEKRIFKHFSLFTKITNLLDTPLIVEVLSPNYLNEGSPAQDRSGSIVVQKDVFHQTFLFGLRLKI